MFNIENLPAEFATGTALADERMITSAFDSLPANRAANALVNLARGLNTDTLGWVVFPSIANRMRRNWRFFDAIATLAMRPGLDLGFYMVLLDFLDSTSRTSRQRARKHFALMTQVAQQRTMPIEVRAKACRLLARDGKTPATRNAVVRISETGEPLLVDAAGHVIVAWRRMGIAVPQRVSAALINWTAAHPREAVHLPGVLRGVAELQTRSAERALRAVIAAAQQPQERLSVLEAIGGQLPDNLFANVVASLDKSRTDETVPVIRSLVMQEPRRLEVILNVVSPDEILRYAPEADRSRRLQRLIDRTRNAGGRAIAPSWELSPEMRAAIQSGTLRSGTLVGTPATPKLGVAYATGFQRADAMYKTLDIWVPGVDNHWHGGLFNAFEGFPDGRGKLSGLHATSDVFDTVHWFSAEGTYFNSVNGTLEAPMQQLRNEFLTAFGVKSGIPYHGARTSRNGVTLAQRRAIIDTAVTLRGEGIDYTWYDMLDYRGTGWSGKPDDIDQIRCDGVIEYCYERQGIRVCGGKNPNERNQWNIAIRGKNHPANHNDLHTFGYNLGELCPRIQAGDQQNDTQFVKPPDTVPIIRSFMVIPGWMESHTPWVILRVEAPFSDWVWARLRVRQVGAPTFDFLVSEPDDFYGRYGGPWLLQAVPANDALGVQWLGKIGAGPQYTGAGLRFEFRLQVIDQGGNVSAEQSTEAVLNFP